MYISRRRPGHPVREQYASESRLAIIGELLYDSRYDKCTDLYAYKSRRGLSGGCLGAVASSWHSWHVVARGENGKNTCKSLMLLDFFFFVALF